MPVRRLALLSRCGFVVLALTAACLSAPGAARAGSSYPLMTIDGKAFDQLGTTVAGVGDINEDGYPDFVVARYAGTLKTAALYYGGRVLDTIPDLTFRGPTVHTSRPIASAGDFNGDGWGDMLVGGVSAQDNRVNLYLGGPGLDALPDAAFSSSRFQFGLVVSPAGDFNGDGYDDVLISSRADSPNFRFVGGIDLYFGNANGTPGAGLSAIGTFANQELGSSTASIGDMNGDGYDDIVVAAGLRLAFVYFGGATPNLVPDLVLRGPTNGSVVVSSAGDFNADGYADVAIEQRGDPSYPGGAYAFLFFGSATPDSVPDLTLAWAASASPYHTVASAGDFNGDGYSDLFVGANGGALGGPGAGQVLVYFGGPNADSEPDQTILGAPGEGLGATVVGPGDLNGDGYADLVAGAPLVELGGRQSGRVYVISKAPIDLVSPQGDEVWVAHHPASVEWRYSGPVDIDLSVDDGATWQSLAIGVGAAVTGVQAWTLIAPDLATTTARVRVSVAGAPVSAATSTASERRFSIVRPIAPARVTLQLDRRATGVAPGDLFGTTVARAGDLDGDGLDDVLIGAPASDANGANSGQVSLWSSRPGSVPQPMWKGESAFDRFGSAVTAGDLNGDGLADVVVGAPGWSVPWREVGSVYIYFGGASIDTVPDLVLEGRYESDEFGTAVAIAGDMNGDGHADLAVGSPGVDTLGVDRGRVFVYYGGPSMDAQPDIVFTGLTPGIALGTTVAGGGDVNGDGYADLMAGAPFNSAAGAYAGRVYVFFGGPRITAAPDIVLSGENAGDLFGSSIALVGDIDGDGRSEIVVGAPYNDAGGEDAGRVYIYRGTTIRDTPTWTLTGDSPGDRFGTSVAGAGDVNADGSPDVIVGAPFASDDGSYAGSAYVYFMSLGVDLAPDVRIRGTATGSGLGSSVATAGDRDGDGFADVVTGAPFSSASGRDAGEVVVRGGTRYRVVSPNGGEAWNVGGAYAVVWRGAEPADVWWSSDDGASYARIATAVGGSETNALTVRVPHGATQTARVRIAPSASGLPGADASDAAFTVRDQIALVSLVASVVPQGAEITWATEPAVGPEGVQGYRVYRIDPGTSGDGVRVGPDLVTANRIDDGDALPGSVYRLAVVNGLGEESEVGRVTLAAEFAGIRAWPTPARWDAAVQVAFTVPLAPNGKPAGDLDVSVYDLAGRRVATLAHGSARPAGTRVALEWRPSRSEHASEAGVYFIRATAPSAGLDERRRIVVLR